MLVAAFIASGVLEVVGVGLVVLDIGRERNAARRLLEVPPSVQVELDASNIRDHPGSLTVRQQQSQQDADIRQAAATAELARTVLLDLVKPDWTRLIGPILIGLGIVVGATANIWAL